MKQSTMQTANLVSNELNYQAYNTPIKKSTSQPTDQQTNLPTDQPTPPATKLTGQQRENQSTNYQPNNPSISLQVFKRFAKYQQTNRYYG